MGTNLRQDPHLTHFRVAWVTGLLVLTLCLAACGSDPDAEGDSVEGQGAIKFHCEDLRIGDWASLFMRNAPSGRLSGEDDSLPEGFADAMEEIANQGLAYSRDGGVGQAYYGVKTLEEVQVEALEVLSGAWEMCADGVEGFPAEPDPLISEQISEGVGVLYKRVMS